MQPQTQVLECRERTAPGVRVEVVVAGDGIRTPQDSSPDCGPRGKASWVIYRVKRS